MTTAADALSAFSPALLLLLNHRIRLLKALLRPPLPQLPPLSAT
jgi:hypothetical protein